MGWGMALPLAQLGISGLTSAFGRGKSRQETLAEANMATQMGRGNRLFQKGEGALDFLTGQTMRRAGGDRSALYQDIAPETQPALQRIDAAQQSAMRLGGRKGIQGSFDPYAKANTVTAMGVNAANAARTQLFDLTKLYGSWGGGEGVAAQQLWQAGKSGRQDSQAIGKSFYDVLEKQLPELVKNWPSGGKKTGKP